jgi:hypothetical protein
MRKVIWKKYVTAAYALMEGYDTSGKLIDAKKQLNETNDE